jgi:hypothetical protein
VTTRSGRKGSRFMISFGERLKMNGKDSTYIERHSMTFSVPCGECISSEIFFAAGGRL